MSKSLNNRVRRTESLSREQIVDTAIHLLDSGGEDGLTFRTLSERLATGPGAIYAYIANKHDLIAAACEAVISRTVEIKARDLSPEETVRTVALAMFDAMDTHPWIGPALTWSAGQLTMVRVLELIGQQIVALEVPIQARWATVSALLNYILGVGGQNAVNTKFAQKLGANREDLLASLSTSWSALPSDAYPFVRSIASEMRMHDDRADFLIGIDLILAGIKNNN
jgi:AcrR family transcriptional regulator